MWDFPSQRRTVGKLQTRRLDLWGKAASFERDAPEATRVQMIGDGGRQPVEAALAGSPVPPSTAPQPAPAPTPAPAADAPAPDACAATA